MVPYWIGYDGQLLALGRRVDDALALYVVDAKTRQIDPEPMISLKGYDFSGDLVDDAQARRLLGVHYETDGSGTAWLDPQMRAMQAAVDALLPATVNRIDCERCVSVPTVLVTAVSDRQPPLYYLYNRDTKALTLIAASRPWIKAQAMGVRDMHRFAARDGLSIPVLVTHPPGKASGARPAVVLVHGGPWVRGTHWKWEPEAQFLASRGYVVIEPEFRGSEGYGFKHFRAGWKQWGLAMQDDVADAVQWAVKQGWVDPKRVCIAGASYGGYATLMGLVRHHELYQCGIEWVGVSDINLMYSISWSDISEEAKGYGYAAADRRSGRRRPAAQGHVAAGAGVQGAAAAADGLRRGRPSRACRARQGIQGCGRPHQQGRRVCDLCATRATAGARWRRTSTSGPGSRSSSSGISARMPNRSTGRS